MKILNLDDFAKSNKSVKLKGISYAVIDMSVEQFIETTAAAERLKGEKDLTKQLEETIQLVVRSIPDCPVAELRKLQFEQLGVLLDFINGDIEGKVKEGLPEQPAGNAAPEKTAAAEPRSTSATCSAESCAHTPSDTRG